MKGAATVDEYIEGHPEWAVALQKLRKVLTATELEETVKWGAPCYTIGGKNVVGVAAMKNHVALWFHQGVFLSDPDRVLITASDGKTKALRQWRFTSAKEIPATRLKAYLREAIANQREGKQLAPARDQPLEMPPELAQALRGHQPARRAFEALSKGRQREYAEYVASAKQAKTKASRLAKILPMIESGVGLNDKYRNC